MTSVVVSHIAKTFHDVEVVPALADVSLEVHSPAVVSIVGANAVGKSTFLRLLAGLLQPDSGTITVNGISPSHVRVGYVPQSNPVFPWRRVKDDIAIPLEIQRVPLEARRLEAERLVARFSFDLPLNRRSHGLSGGQRQLVNLCRALVGPEPPELLLLDEPFAALDPISRHEFLGHLQRVMADFGLVAFLTTHLIDLAIMSSDLVVPFKSRPVILLEEDVIPISIPRPRTDSVRSSTEFMETLGKIESTFRVPRAN